MTSLDTLLMLALFTVLFTLAAGNRRWSGGVATLLYAAQFMVLVSMAGSGYRGDIMVASPGFSVFGLTLQWQLTALGWFFALITLGAGLLSSGYAAGEWGRTYAAGGRSLRLLQVTLAVNVFSMLLLLVSADFLSLFIGWELVSWASLWLMLQGGERAVKAAMRYLPYAMAGAMALLGAITLVYTQGGDLGFADFHGRFAAMDTALRWTLVLLFTAGFGVKMAMVPFHLWQPRAYSEAPGAGAVFLAAISSRMGLFAMALVLVRLVGIEQLAQTTVAGLVTPQDIIMGLAAATIIIGAFVALRQDDARLLLAWSGISQGGYMILGLVSGGSLAAAGGLMHVFSYASYEAGLFMVVFAVIHRTGTADMNKLGGLVTRMPVSFVVLLMGIIGLAGLPPINGFVSKWMIYRGLLDQQLAVYFLVAVIGTLGSVLYCYKLIHNIFLGQLRLEHETVREVPWSMTVPMLLLAAIMFLTGYMPGLVLDWVATVMSYLGLAMPTYHLGGIETAGGNLDMLWLVSFMLLGFGIGAVIFYSGGRARRVHQLDNYAGGHFLSSAARYQYSYNFYPALERLIGRLYRGSFRWFESGVISFMNLASTGAQGIYRSVHPAIYLLAVVVLSMLLWVID